MGLLDSVLSSVLGGNAASSPLQGVLGSLLGGSGTGGVLGSLMGGRQQPASQEGGLAGMGGLGGLLAQFQQAGLGHIADSWVGNGPNQSVTPDQLSQVFGQQRVDDMAQQANMPAHDMLSQLSQFLPHAVDKMTPNGAPAAGSSPFDQAGTGL